MSKKKRVTKKLKDDLLHYFLHNEIVEGEAKQIASIVDQFVPNPHILPVETLEDAIRRKQFCFLHKFYTLPPILPPVDGEERKNNWIMRIEFRYGRYFRYSIKYYNYYDHNRKECFREVTREFRYKYKGTPDRKALYVLRDIILTNMHNIKKGCMNKVYGHYWQHCGNLCLPGHNECEHCVKYKLKEYFKKI